MHLLAILAFAVLFWRAETPGAWRLVPADDIMRTVVVVAGLPLLLALAGVWAASRACALHDRHPDAPHVAQRFHHRTVLILRTALFVGFAAAVLLTR